MFEVTQVTPGIPTSLFTSERWFSASAVGMDNIHAETFHGNAKNNRKRMLV